MKRTLQRNKIPHCVGKTVCSLLMLGAGFSIGACNQTFGFREMRAVLKNCSHNTPSQRYTAVEIYQFCLENQGNMQRIVAKFGKPDYVINYGNNLRFSLIGYVDRVNNQLVMVYYNADEELTIELRDNTNIMPLSVPSECLDDVQY